MRLNNSTTGNDRDSGRLELRGVSVAYGNTPVLCDVTLEVEPGVRLAVVGPNGAGKSTLFKALVGLLPLGSGSVLVHGQPGGGHRDCIAYVPQREEVDWSFPVTVADVVMMGRYGRNGWLQALRKEDRVAVDRSLSQMGLANLSDRPIDELSGGQQQRVFLARALAQEPHILLMDEPFTGVDVTTQEAVLELLDQLKQQGVTVLVSTHDLNLVANRFEQVLLLNRRVIAYGPPSQVLRPETVAEAFGSQVVYLEGGIMVDQCCPPEEHGAGRVG